MKNQDILVIFDLDGVLMESKMLHFEALNKSLAKFNISITYEEHLENHSQYTNFENIYLLQI